MMAEFNLNEKDRNKGGRFLLIINRKKANSGLIRFCVYFGALFFCDCYFREFIPGNSCLL